MALASQQQKTSQLKRVQRKKFTMQEHSDTIKSLWYRFTQVHFGRDEEFMTDELPIRPVLNFLVKEGIALDRDKAK